MGSKGSKRSNVDFSGSADLEAGFAIDLGADDSFFGLFDNSKLDTVFSENFELFQTSFGQGNSERKRELPGRRTLGERRELVKRVDLVCPRSLPPRPSVVTNKTVKAKRISR